MPDPVAIQSDDMSKTRDDLRKTLTPQRLFVLSWASAAIIFGAVGLAAYHFGAPGASVVPSYAGIRLPPAGPVTSTASIGLNGQDVSVGVMESRNGHMITAETQINEGQIQTLQREIVSLRRRLSMLSEQNLSYSKRIASLEKHVEQQAMDAAPEIQQTQPSSAVADPQPAPPPATPRPDETASKQTERAASPQVTSDIEVLPAPETRKPVRIRTLREIQAAQRLAEAAERVHEPVRIVELPAADDATIATGSIPETQAPEIEPEPTQAPMMIRPSAPAGRTTGGGKVSIGRSDFGAVIGRYEDEQAAAKAWAVIKEQNSERMTDLRPVMTNSEMAEGQIELLVGPFANAADAAVACFRLLDISETCHPSLFVGTPVPVVEPETAEAPANSSSF